MISYVNNIVDKIKPLIKVKYRFSRLINKT